MFVKTGCDCNWHLENYWVGIEMLIVMQNTQEIIDNN